MLRDIQDSDTACKDLLSLVDAFSLTEGLRDQAQKIDDLSADLIQHLQHCSQEQREWRQSDDESRCLQALYTTTYEEFKSRNPDRVEGTCEWFLKSGKYQAWERNESSDLLWVTADPGCGKSVLAKSLIDNELRNPLKSITCYFFFKDDSADQKSAVKAVSALLHQVLARCKNHQMLRKAVEIHKARGQSMNMSFDLLWELLLDVARDYESGQIFLVIDALDECENSGRESIIRGLNSFCSEEGKAGRIKFLIEPTIFPY